MSLNELFQHRAEIHGCCVSGAARELADIGDEWRVALLVLGGYSMGFMSDLFQNLISCPWSHCGHFLNFH